MSNSEEYTSEGVMKGEIYSEILEIQLKKLEVQLKGCQERFEDVRDWWLMWHIALEARLPTGYKELKKILEPTLEGRVCTLSS